MNDFVINFQRTEALNLQAIYPEIPDDLFQDDLTRDRNGVSAREALAENLIRLCSNAREPLRIMLDGAWGSGKTWFLKRLHEMLLMRSSEFIVTYINAWEIDFATDPFTAFVSEISCQMNFSDKAKWTASNVIKSTFNSTRLKLPFTSLDLGKFAESMDSNVDIFSELTADYVQLKKAREAFKIEIERQLRDDLDQKLIIIIDELDRCEPKFAITLMERIKHFFEIKGVSVIAATDKDQLCESIKGAFGQGYMSDRYLNRIFDFEIGMPRDSIGTFANTKYMQMFGDVAPQCAKDFAFFCSRYAYDQQMNRKKHDANTPFFTLRDVERMLNRIDLFTTMLKRESKIVHQLAVAIICGRETNRADYIIHLLDGTSAYDGNIDYWLSEMFGGEEKENDRRERYKMALAITFMDTDKARGHFINNHTKDAYDYMFHDLTAANIVDEDARKAFYFVHSGTSAMDDAKSEHQDSND